MPCIVFRIQPLCARIARPILSINDYAGSRTLYAVQPPRYHPEEPNWRDYHRFTADQLPTSVRSWLLHPGSLTQRLIRASDNQFQVLVLSQRWQRPLKSERQLLGMAEREVAIIREVALLCKLEPWVFARSVMPLRTLQGPLRHLRKLKNSPLGELLFRDPSMRRHPFQVARLQGTRDVPQGLAQTRPLWGRRCRFELATKPILVSEIFLEAFRP